MANQKPKKSGKKNEDSSQAETKKAVQAVKETKEAKKTEEVEKAEKVETEKKVVATAAACDHPFKGFFARKYGDGENLLTIFKTPKIWGALLGEMLGTMMLAMIMIIIGIFGGLFQYALYLAPAIICVYVVIVKVSGANFNPLITAGMMATRRMSAIRGILYMLAQLLGAWLGLIVINGFLQGSGIENAELPVMTTVTGESFWAVALIEMVGAIILGFCFARGIKYARRSPLTFAFTVVSSLIFVILLGAMLSQGFFQMMSSFAFNPVIALMYQILPTTADNFGELAKLVGLALAAYVAFPVIGGIVGFFLSETVTRLSCGGYLYALDDEEEYCHHAVSADTRKK